MTTPLWQPGHLYLTGDLVQPIKASAPASTVLTNPGFESGVITGWTVTAPGGGTSSVASDKKYAGTYAGRWQGLSGGVAADWVNATEVPVKPGQSVSASIYISLDDTGSSANQGRVRLYWYNAAHTLLSSTDGLLIHGNSSAWYASTVTAVAPASAAYARMGAWTSANASGGVRIDSAAWSIVAAAAPAGLIYKAVQTGPGTSSSAEPTWPSTLGATVVDGTVTWEAVTASRVVWEASPLLQSGATEPTWPTEVGGFVIDGTISWECVSRRVEDPKCPTTTVRAIIASKVFAADGDIVRFSATANPLDWTTPNDAGYLPTGLQQANANDIAVLAPYRGNLCPMNASSFQNWQVDPDPAQMALLDQMEGIGSTFQHAAQAVANDLFFLPKLGVRSVGISVGADNLAAGDIGMPIDVLVQDAMRVAAANGTQALATYYPSAGQYWLAFSEYPPPGLQASGNLADNFIGDVVAGSYSASGGVAPYTFAVTDGTFPPGLALASDGDYDGTSHGGGDDSPRWDYAWTVTVTDADGTTATLNDTCRVTNMTLSGDMPNGTQGDSGTTTYTADHHVGAVTYSLVGGALPGGATLNSNGSAPYTYSTGGNFSFRIRGVDTVGNTAYLDDTVTVAGYTWAMARSGSEAMYLTNDVVNGPWTATTRNNGPTRTTQYQILAGQDKMFVFGGTTDALGYYGTDFDVTGGLDTSIVSLGNYPVSGSTHGAVWCLPYSNSSGYSLSVNSGASFTGYAPPLSKAACRGMAKLDTGRWLLSFGNNSSPCGVAYTDDPLPTSAATWTATTISGQTDSFGSPIACNGVAACFVISNGRVYRTTDGVSLSHVYTSSVASGDKRAAIAIGNVFLLGVGQGGDYIRSTDAGLTWANLTFPAACTPVQFTYDGIVLVANCVKHNYYSLDLGLTWATLPLPFSRSFNEGVGTSPVLITP